ncbi:MAG TPA: hypothetical protein VMM92_13630, partial [Thermoanaerobaculia bacterium]|nr:hypothetical protein [Thermoanaerobaculia bacterium]
MRRARLLCLAAHFFFCLHAAKDVAAETWRSPVQDWVFFQIEKARTNPAIDLENPSPGTQFKPLPPQVIAAISPEAMDYESILAGYLPTGRADALASRLESLGLRYTVGIDRRLQLPWHLFDTGDIRSRSADFSGSGLIPQEVPNLYLVQFAYPIEESWLQVLTSCGAQQIAYFAQRTVLVKAASQAVILSCSVAPFLSWIDSYLTTDRISPEMLKQE